MTGLLRILCGSALAGAAICFPSVTKEINAIWPTV